MPWGGVLPLIRNTIQHSATLTPHGQKLLQKALSNARQHIPQLHSEVEGRIRETNVTTYLVYLENRTCGCSHAIAAIYATHQAPIDYMPIYLRRTTYLEMYEQNLPSISLADPPQDV